MKVDFKFKCKAIACDKYKVCQEAIGKKGKFIPSIKIVDDETVELTAVVECKDFEWEKTKEIKK